jgi:hypothetical protein
MKIQVQFNCPVGVVVDTETGEVDSVHVWDEHIDKVPSRAYWNEYIKAGHPEFEAQLTAQTANNADLADVYQRNPYLGVSVFEELPLDDPEVVKALAVIDSGAEWPGWQFDA